VGRKEKKREREVWGKEGRRERKYKNEGGGRLRSGRKQGRVEQWRRNQERVRGSEKREEKKRQ
jgi:hypothetical protein